MTVPPIKIATLNCRGIATQEARRTLFHYLRKFPFDIICLQETNTPSTRADFWTQQWLGPALWSRHVGILLHPKHSFRSHSFSHQQRLLIADVTVQGHTFSVANMYAPSNSTARSKFFRSLSPATFAPCTFVAGDWNCVPDPTQDRVPYSPGHHGHWPLLAPSLTSFFDAALQGARLTILPLFIRATDLATGWTTFLLVWLSRPITFPLLWRLLLALTINWSACR